MYTLSSDLVSSLHFPKSTFTGFLRLATMVLTAFSTTLAV